MWDGGDLRVPRHQKLGLKAGEGLPGGVQLHWQRQSQLDSLDRAVWEGSCSALPGSASMFSAALCATMGPTCSKFVSFKVRHSKWPLHSFSVEMPRVNIDTHLHPARNGTGSASFRVQTFPASMERPRFVISKLGAITQSQA